MGSSINVKPGLNDYGLSGRAGVPLEQTRGDTDSPPPEPLN